MIDQSVWDRGPAITDAFKCFPAFQPIPVLGVAESASGFPSCDDKSTEQRSHLFSVVAIASENLQFATADFAQVLRPMQIFLRSVVWN